MLVCGFRLGRLFLSNHLNLQILKIDRRCYKMYQRNYNASNLLKPNTSLTNLLRTEHNMKAPLSGVYWL